MSMMSMINPASMVTRPETFTPAKLERAKLTTVDKLGKKLPPSSKRYAELECQFNPKQLKITKEVAWEGSNTPGRNAPDLDFKGGKPAEFSLSLVFDTSQASKSAGQDVRKYTNQLLKLAMMGKRVGNYRIPPPRVQFEWGKITLFMAVVKKVTLTYLLFLPDGTPVRAKADVDFIQQDVSDDEKGKTNPTTRTEARRTRRVQMGERLDMIAYEEYGHPRHWRHLAEANDLLDPTDLRPGQILVIPPLP